MLRRLFPLAALLWGCVPELDTTRAPRPELTLGENVYAEMCNRIAIAEDPYDVSGAKTRDTCLLGKPPPPGSSPRLEALAAERSRLVWAVDAAVPPSVADDLGDLLVELLPLYDSGTVQAQSRAVADVLGSLAASPESLAALERCSAREGYKPVSVALGLARPMLAYPELPELTEALLGALRPGGVAKPAFDKILTGVQRDLAATQLGFDGDESVAKALLLREHDDFTDGVQRFIARRDGRGIVQPATRGQSLVTPFVDTNADGLADVDVRGRLLGQNGQPVTVGAPFKVPYEPSSMNRDAHGRLKSGDGGLVYEYRDTSRTLLGGLLHESRELLRENSGVVLDLVPPTELMGPVATRTYIHDDGSGQVFNGYDLDQAPLLDMVHAGTVLFDDPVFYWTLRLAEPLVEEHEHEVARAVELAFAISDRADAPAFRDQDLEPGAILTDEMYALTTEIMREPGLWEDLIAALRDPRTRALGEIYARYLRYKDRVTFDPDDPNGPPIGDLTTPVDRSEPDTFDNRSIFQRFLHLIHDTNRAQMCNKQGAVLDLGFITYPIIGSYDECELLQVDNLAVFYVQSAIGRAELEFKDPVVALLSDLDFLLEDLSGIVGFTSTPTPQAINRLVFAPRNSFLQQIVDPPRAADGGLIEERHPGTIFAWERYDFFEKMRPLFEAFDDHGRTDLFVDMMSILHRHWSSHATDTTQSDDPTATAYANQSGAVRFEELVAQILDDEAALDVLAELLDAADATSVDGVMGMDVVVDLGRQLYLPEWNPGLMTRQGDDFVTWADGTPTEELAPIWLLRAAGRAMDEALEASPAAHQRYDEASRKIIRQLLEVQTVGGEARLKDRRARAALLTLLAFGRERIYDHWAAEDVEAWAAELVVDLEDGMNHPMVPGILELSRVVADNPSLRQPTDDLLVYLVDVLSPNQAFDATLSASADFLQLLDDDAGLKPILKQVAPLFDPEDGAVTRTLDFLDEAQERDPSRALARLQKGLVTPGPSGETPLEAIIDVVAQVNRVDPEQEGPLSAQDYSRILTRARDFMTDEVRGLERLYELIEHR